MGFKFYATKGTADFMKANGINAEVLYWPLEKKNQIRLHILQMEKLIWL